METIHHQTIAREYMDEMTIHIVTALMESLPANGHSSADEYLDVLRRAISNRRINASPTAAGVERELRKMLDAAAEDFARQREEGTET